MLLKTNLILKKLLRPKGKLEFLSNLPATVSILDVGCGNNSPFLVKKILPNCSYTGIDIEDNKQGKLNLADKYVLTNSENFSNEIDKMHEMFDAVLSSHNIEHCDKREETLIAMLMSLKVDGKLFLSFPSEESVNFPRRRGTLNYYDDSTHKYSPPKFQEILNLLSKFGFEISFAEKRYSPLPLKLVGAMFEPFSRITKRVWIGTWEYYGFESIIIAKKLYRIPLRSQHIPNRPWK
jgi:SAM-dependent methyltransferase